MAPPSRFLYQLNAGGIVFFNLPCSYGTYPRRCTFTEIIAGSGTTGVGAFSTNDPPRNACGRNSQAGSRKLVNVSDLARKASTLPKARTAQPSCIAESRSCVIGSGLSLV